MRGYSSKMVIQVKACDLFKQTRLFDSACSCKTRGALCDKTADNMLSVPERDVLTEVH